MQSTTTVEATGPQGGANRAATLLGLCCLGAIATACAPKIASVRPFAVQTAGLYQASGAETQGVLTQYSASIALAEEICTSPTFAWKRRRASPSKA